MARTIPKLVLMAIAVAAFVALAPGRAEACGGGSSAAAITASTLLAVPVAADLVFTGYDLVTAVQEEHARQGWAIAEVAVTAPQFVFGAVGVAESKWDNNLIVPGFYVLWMGALTGHGIVSLATMPPSGPGAPRRDEPATEPKKPYENPRLGMITPTLLGDGASRTLVPGVSASGTF